MNSSEFFRRDFGVLTDCRDLLDHPVQLDLPDLLVSLALLEERYQIYIITANNNIKKNIGNVFILPKN